MDINKPYECDLHTHTNRSDGNDTYEQLIDYAVLRGLKVVAITDHDVSPKETIEYKGKELSLWEYGKRKGIYVIPGIEFSCNTDVEDVHVVGLACDYHDKRFDTQMRLAVESKIDGYKELCRKLSEQGMTITWEELMVNGSKIIKESEVQKKMIFELIAKKGYIPDWSSAKLLIKNDPNLRIKRKKPDAQDMIRLIKESGGIALLAHPYLIANKVQYGKGSISRDEYICRLIDAGLDGIEGAYTYDKTSYVEGLQPEEIEEQIREKYQDKVAFISGGSDYHHDSVKGVKNERMLGEKGVSLSDMKNCGLFDEIIKD